MAWVRTWLCRLQKRMHLTRNASEKVYQLLAHGRRFSLGTPASRVARTVYPSRVPEFTRVVRTVYPSREPEFKNCYVGVCSSNYGFWLHLSDYTCLITLVSDYHFGIFTLFLTPLVSSIWSKYIPVDSIFQSLWFLSRVPLG